MYIYIQLKYRKMKFCTNCENMYYIQLQEENNAIEYYCRKCGHTENSFDQNIIVSKTNVTKQNSSNQNIINQYTKLDPTIPRIHTISCMNKSCSSNTDENVVQDILYVRYDTDELKYMYMCTICNSQWSNSMMKTN